MPESESWWDFIDGQWWSALGSSDRTGKGPADWHEVDAGDVPPEIIAMFSDRSMN